MPDTTVHEYPFGGATRLLALALAVGPLAAAPAVLGEREVRISCVRTGPSARDGACTIEHARVLTVARREVPLASVLGARLEGGQSGATGIALITPDGPIAVDEDLPPDVAARIVREISAFLVDPAARQVDARAERGAGLGIFYAVLAAALAILGALAYRSAPRVRVELDADMDAVRVVRTLWPLRSRAKSTARAEIADVVVEGIPEAAPDRHRVTIVRKDGAREPLTTAFHAGDEAAHVALADAIRAFVASP